MSTTEVNEIVDITGQVHKVPPPLPLSAACMACGISVRGPFDPDEVEIVDSVLFHGGNGFAAVVTLARCATCALIHAAAEDLMVSHREVAYAIGDSRIAQHRIELALNALDALGVTDARVIDRLTDTGTDLRRLIEHMTVAGGEARWVSQISPRPAPGVRPEGASVTRWGHVTTEQRNALRRAQVALGVARNERPAPVPAPAADGGACMLCGVGSWPALLSQRNNVWTEMSADPETIGGRPAPDSIDGCVCPRCDQAIDRASGVGQSAMAISIRDLLGVPHGIVMEAFGGVTAWAVVPDAQPNAEPWDHVDLDAARAEMRLLGIRPGGAAPALVPMN